MTKEKTKLVANKKYLTNILLKDVSGYFNYYTKFYIRKGNDQQYLSASILAMYTVKRNLKMNSWKSISNDENQWLSPDNQWLAILTHRWYKENQVSHILVYDYELVNKIYDSKVNNKNL